MQRYPYYEVSAFSRGAFTGNPAGVVFPNSWPSDAMMQKIAEQNNLAETAFVVPERDGYRIRWFTPNSEIDLCGHATLGSAYALMQHDRSLIGETPIRFYYAGGSLEVKKSGDLFMMNFPLITGERLSDSETRRIGEALGIPALEAYLGRDLALVVPSEQHVREFPSTHPAIAQLPGLGCIITAPGDQYDIVSRAFFPELGIVEDPVTGSAHCFLAWIWGEKLKRQELSAFQASPRGGELGLTISDDRVILRGAAEGYLCGEIVVPKNYSESTCN
jgi:predicted PhzF superfamily epimerase YddE/YHI9